ncbi:Na+/H+ antiporter [Luteimonas sp BLCC-B24]|uniref:Na+/H+ antiporter n=1 Tax=Luteimonas sp. BLCC-B24 TaxID=3025317 RepID=UPI00234E22E4|nr:Na+/H+ antiporter [Luteimonas sp. BLCC-B24]MDC7808182.1 Na+/H+ antiporter [Luteimonas sp. BLCC-B24]
MHSIEVVLVMLLAVVVSGYLTRVLQRWVPVPLPVVQIALGATIAGVFGQGVALDPHLFFVLFLPPLLFLDGWRIPKSGLFRDRGLILPLALGLVVFTVLGAGLLIHWLIPAMPLPVAFALAAILSPTDPVAVSSIAARAPIPPRVMHILEGESLLNDASGLVCFRFAVAAVMTGSFSLVSASLTFLWVALAGVAIGVAVTVAINRGHALVSRVFGEEAGTPILISLLTPFGAYLLAEQVAASGILAAVAAGITMSYVEFSGRALATTRVQRAAVWDTVQFSLNGIIFVLLGEQLPWIVERAATSVREAGHATPWWLAIYVAVISGALLALRFAWVWVSLRIALYRRHDRRAPPWRLVAAMSVAGVRGAITLAGVLTLPLLLPGGAPFPARDLAIFLAAAVIVVSLLLGSVALPRLLHGLTLPAEDAPDRDIDRARHAGAVAAVAAVERAQHALPAAQADPDLYASAAVRVMALYQERLRRGGAGVVEASELRRADAAERALRLAAVEAERDCIHRLARQRAISDEVARRLVRDLDLLEARYR